MTRWRAKAVLGSRRTTCPLRSRSPSIKRDRRRAAELARRSARIGETAPVAPVAEALRDDAIATGDYALALKEWKPGIR